MILPGSEGPTQRPSSRLKGQDPPQDMPKQDMPSQEALRPEVMARACRTFCPGRLSGQTPESRKGRSGTAQQPQRRKRAIPRKPPRIRSNRVFYQRSSMQRRNAAAHWPAFAPACAHGPGMPCFSSAGTRNRLSLTKYFRRSVCVSLKTTACRSVFSLLISCAWVVILPCKKKVFGTFAV